MKNIFTIIGLTVFLVVMCERGAFAYLDPGTGSMILQATIGTLLAATYAVKVYWKKIVSFFKKEKNQV